MRKEESKAEAPKVAKAKTKSEPEIRVTHYTGSTLISINRPYPSGELSEALRLAVKDIIDKA